MNTILCFRKGHIIRVFTPSDDGNGFTYEDRHFLRGPDGHKIPAINQAKRASRLIGLGKVRNVDVLPESIM